METEQAPVDVQTLWAAQRAAQTLQRIHTLLIVLVTLLGTGAVIGLMLFAR
jgi:hypothetical protein